MILVILQIKSSNKSNKRNTNCKNVYFNLYLSYLLLSYNPGYATFHRCGIETFTVLDLYIIKQLEQLPVGIETAV